LPDNSEKRILAKEISPGKNRDPLRTMQNGRKRTPPGSRRGGRTAVGNADRRAGRAAVHSLQLPIRFDWSRDTRAHLKHDGFSEASCRSVLLPEHDLLGNAGTFLPTMLPVSSPPRGNVLTAQYLCDAQELSESQILDAGVLGTHRMVCRLTR
jgi:hypothetical protein